MENRRNGWFSGRTPGSAGGGACGGSGAAAAVFVVAVSVDLGVQQGRFPAGLRLRRRDRRLSGEEGRRARDKAPACCFDPFLDLKQCFSLVSDELTFCVDDGEGNR